MYDDLSSKLRMWYPGLKSMRDKYFTLFNFGKISLSVGPLWTGLISAWFSLAMFRHSLTLPLGFGIMTKLLHHSAISYMPKGVIMSSCWDLFNSSLNSFYSAYAMHLGGTWYVLLSGFSCNENVPSKHPIPVKTSSTPFVAVLLFQHLLFCHFLCLDLQGSFQFHYCLVRGHYIVYCLNLNCHHCFCLSLLGPGREHLILLVFTIGRKALYSLMFEFELFSLYSSLHCCLSEHNSFPGLCLHSTDNFLHWGCYPCLHCNLCLSPFLCTYCVAIYV